LLCHVSPHFAYEHGTATSYDESGGIPKGRTEQHLSGGISGTSARKERPKEEEEIINILI